jgi:rhamnosyl/mannosyltransferase
VKVLQISKFYPPVRGGIETATFELVEGLCRLGFEVDVLCANTGPISVRELFPSGYTVTRSGSFGRFLSVSMAPSLLRNVRRFVGQYDLIHLHMPDPLSALALWCARPEVPVVLHWHSDVVRQRVSKLLYLPLQRWLLKRADSIIATSPPYALSSTDLRGWRSKTQIIPLGIGDARRGPPDPIMVERIRSAVGGRRIIFALGRMAAYKGFEVLVDAALLLPCDCVVVIAGGGEGLERLEQYVVSRGAKDRVMLVGEVSDEAVNSFFDAAEAFCLPSTSRAEAFGIAMLESMAQSKPVIATNIPGSGVSWLNRHGETGVNVRPGCPVSLAEGIQQIMSNDRMRREYSANARQRYLREFTAEIMTQRIADLYERLVAGGEPAVCGDYRAVVRQS